MVRGSFVLVCLMFGFAMLAIPVHAAEVERVYCKFDLKKWESSKGLFDFLKKGSDCDVEIETEWGEFSYSQPVVPDLNLKTLWFDVVGE